MKTVLIVLLAGLLGPTISTSALAHDPAYGYRHDRIGGGVSVWVDPYGRVSYGGSLRYGIGGYKPGHIPWIAHRHGPQCRHGDIYGHHGAYAKDYRHGHHHGRHPGGHHGRGHHRRHRGGHHGKGHHRHGNRHH